MENMGKKSAYGINNASMLKRFAAWLVDMVIFVVLLTGFLWLTGKIFNYDNKYNELRESYASYGIITEVKDDDLDVYCEIERNESGYPVEGDACYNAYVAFYDDEGAVKLEKQCNNIMISMLTTSSLLAILIVELLFPLVLKNNKTIGYWAMHIGLIGKDGIKPSKVQLFARAVIGRWAIETVIPLLCIVYMMLNLSGGLYGTIIVAFIILIELMCMFTLPYHQSLHDLVSNTVPVDADVQYFAVSQEDLTRKLSENNQR